MSDEEYTTAYDKKMDAIIAKGYDPTNPNEVNSVNYLKSFQNFNAFENHDFAKLLNLSVGYEFKISDSKLIAEPYTKIPLGKMGGTDLKFGHSGFRLQYYF